MVGAALVAVLYVRSPLPNPRLRKHNLLCSPAQSCDQPS
mgnify:CR=1 FL=1